jgi:hypothetical protein
MEFVLDIAKWRSGGWAIEDERMGEGDTQLCNSEGYMCCLGQFAKQCGYEGGAFMVAGDPCELITFELEDIYPEFDWQDGSLNAEMVVPLIRKGYEPFIEIENSSDEGFDYHNSELAKELIEVNDDTGKSPAERVEGIRKLLEEAGHTLKVVNEHLLEVVELESI